MQDSFSALVVVVLGALALGLVVSRYRQADRGLLALAFAAHVGSAIAQVLITDGLYGGGDIFGYAFKGTILAAALRMDFQSVGWELLKVLLQQDGMPPVAFAGIGSSTGSMTALTAFLFYLTGGNIYTGCIVLGIAGFYGKLAIYEVFRQSYPEVLHRRLLICSLLIPSVVFWSSALLKEAVAMVGLGPLLLGVYRLLHRRPLSGLLLVTFGVITVALVKAYILFAFTLATGAWIYTSRAKAGRAPLLRPVHLATGVAVAIVGIALLGKLFPQYAVDSLADQAAYHQEIGQVVRGGSTYELVASGSEESASAQALYAPLALLTSLFRPLLFEASSPQILVNALETTTLLVMTVGLFWRVPLRSLWQALLDSPMAIFSLTFVVSFGIAVGLATTNLGTLSRYRMPLVPFFAALLVVLRHAERSAPAPTELAPRSLMPNARRLPPRPIRPTPRRL